MKQRFFKYRFYLPSTSPTYINLQNHLTARSWRATRYTIFADFNEKNFAFHTNAANALEYKHLLAKLAWRYFPDAIPESYTINDKNWLLLLNYLAEKHYKPLHDQLENLVWILKPSLLNNGQNIKIFRQLSEIEQHYFTPNRLGGNHVLQRYLMNPHLLNGNKYSIRMFVVMTNFSGVYLYRHGYFNIGLYSYQPNDFSDLRCHLTNEHLLESEDNIIQVPTYEFNDMFAPVYQKIKAIISRVAEGLKKLYPDAFICRKQKNLAIFGFDFMLDSDMRPWLLEANHGPCFPIHDQHPLQNKLYDEFWCHFIDSFILPIVNKHFFVNTYSTDFDVVL